MRIPGVKVPQSLLQTPREELESYVQLRLHQFIGGLSQHLAGVHPQVLQEAATKAYHGLEPPDYGQIPPLKIQFTHDCDAQGCHPDLPCALCAHSTDRRCTRTFEGKYLTDVGVRARCGAPIRLELVDPSTGAVHEEALDGVELEMIVLDGKGYDEKFKEEAARGVVVSSDEELNGIRLLTNNRGTPLLVSSIGGSGNDEQGVLVLRPMGGKVVLQEVQITDSCEAMMKTQGKRPPVRFLVRAKHRRGLHVPIEPALSDDFVVATQRTRNDGKVVIPSMDDPVSKIVNLGKETVKKLADLQAAAVQSNMMLAFPEGCCNEVKKVGEFLTLVHHTDQDGQLRKELLTLLKLSKEKWEDACAHARQAVAPDNMMRAWYADMRTMALGLLFPCSLAKIKFDRPAALLVRQLGPAGEPIISIMPAQTAEQREAVGQLLQQATECWKTAGHTGWMLTTVSSDHFDSVVGSGIPVPLSALHPSAVVLAPTAPLPSVQELTTMMDAGPLPQDVHMHVAQAMASGACPPEVEEFLKQRADQVTTALQSAAPAAAAAPAEAPAAEMPPPPPLGKGFKRTLSARDRRAPVRQESLDGKSPFGDYLMGEDDPLSHIHDDGDHHHHHSDQRATAPAPGASAGGARRLAGGFPAPPEPSLLAGQSFDALLLAIGNSLELPAPQRPRLGSGGGSMLIDAGAVAGAVAAAQQQLREESRAGEPLPAGGGAGGAPAGGPDEDLVMWSSLAKPSDGLPGATISTLLQLDGRMPSALLGSLDSAMHGGLSLPSASLLLSQLCGAGLAAALDADKAAAGGGGDGGGAYSVAAAKGLDTMATLEDALVGAAAGHATAAAVTAE